MAEAVAAPGEGGTAGAGAGAGGAGGGDGPDTAVRGLTGLLRAARDSDVDAAIAAELAPGDRSVVGAGRAALTTAAGCERILRAASSGGGGGGESEIQNGGDDIGGALKAAASAMAWLNGLAAARSDVKGGHDGAGDAALARIAEVARLAHGGGAVASFARLGKAMQVDPMKPTWKAPGSNRLKL